ncbi:substrate-binding domain-containing protein [Actinosynnema sp. NPDC047251]|uniref:von Willebrand factor type A family protein n=1 Tax=Saccharothrix espanaensis (strain ATCC 51144 / DSM 44229 / JCM 9112 / NBRC 15066 / NRRL 15764) TaxID=1179773 RepID=K0JUR3_SACES|nr:substrate-binding domain-containing protein [Saccharothrix espanaensis]CCH29252.1 von Willebrand factor type A family protein [Saccharothrix espanaensis DSM 44229]
MLVVALVGGCTSQPEPVTLMVLAGAELADLRPVLAELRRDTGVDLRLDHRGTVRASAEIRAGARHDLAWLSTSRYLRLAGGTVPLATSVMLSPVVVGVKPGKVKETSPSWASLASVAGVGELKYLMADPRVAGSGLAALIGVATAAAGTGAALKPEDVRCDKVQGFLVGRAAVTEAEDVAEEYVRQQDQLDAVVTYESTVLSLNASGRVREQLEVVYPRDGIVLADYPVMLLKPEKRVAYDRVVGWLLGERGQRALMGTFRRPVDAGVDRPAALRAELGTSLYFPGSQGVVDALLAAYDRAGEPARVVFVLDYSTSMAGERIDGLRDVFARLSGIGGGVGSGVAGTGGFEGFRVGESITVVRFAGSVLAADTVVVRGAADLVSLQGLLAGELQDGTAVWSALDVAYREAAGGVVVVLTDGENNAGMTVNELLAAWPKPARTYAVRFGTADPVELGRVAAASGGRVVEADGVALAQAVKDIRGC